MRIHYIMSTFELKPPESLRVNVPIQTKPKKSSRTSLTELQLVKPLPQTTSDTITNTKATLKCFWCRQSIGDADIQCPIRYFPTEVQQTCLSEITNESYSIRQSIPSHSDIPQSNIKVVTDGYYQTEGQFCSYNCCIAYIEDNTNHHQLYSRSKVYLYKILLTQDWYVKGTIIHPSPHWKLLSEYSGHMTPEEYKKSIGTRIYTTSGNKRMNVKTIPLNEVFDETIIL